MSRAGQTPQSPMVQPNAAGSSEVLGTSVLKRPDGICLIELCKQPRSRAEKAFENVTQGSVSEELACTDSRLYANI